MLATEAPDHLSASISAKVHRRVLPLLMAGWFIAYIDRFNVSYAALQMNQALGLSPAIYGLGGGLFFLGYALFEVPSNMVLARVGARRWLGRIMITWGLVTIAAMWIQGAASFYAMRLLLGVAEAGCFPGMAYCLSQWLPPRERASALASLGLMAMVSGVVAGPLAAALLALDGIAGLQGWQWLFLLEGIPAVLIGLCVLAFLPDRPDAVSWLSFEEKEWMKYHVDPIERRSPTRAHLATVLSDGRYWMWGASFFCAASAGSAVVLFRPVMMQQMAGLNDTATAILTAVPSLAGAVAMIYVGRRATRHDERRRHAAIPMLVGSIGVGLLGVVYGLPGVLAVASLSAVAAASQPALFASVSAASKGAVNAVGIAFVNSISAVGGFLGPYALGYMIDVGWGLAVACAVAGAILAFGGCLALLVREQKASAAPTTRASVVAT